MVTAQSASIHFSNMVTSPMETWNYMIKSNLPPLTITRGPITSLNRKTGIAHPLTLKTSANTLLWWFGRWFLLTWQVDHSQTH